MTKQVPIFINKPEILLDTKYLLDFILIRVLEKKD